MRTAWSWGGPGRLSGACLAFALSLAAGAAGAAPPSTAPAAGVGPRAAAAALDDHGLVWRPEFRDLHWIDYAVTASFGVGTVILQSLPVGNDPDNYGGILFDDSIRDALVLHNADDRAAFGSFSDVALTTLLAYPYVVDAGLTALVVRRSPKVAWNMTIIDMEAFGFTFLISQTLKRLVDRARPLVRECQKDPNYDAGCNEPGLNYSFFSGHSAISFTGAGLICTHHLQLGLLESDADTMSCVSALTLAWLTGVSRIAADKHYATDVASGALVGLFSGALMPYLLYYMPRQTPADHVVAGGVIAPMVSPSALGATYFRLF